MLLIGSVPSSRVRGRGPSERLQTLAVVMDGISNIYMYICMFLKLVKEEYKQENAYKIYPARIRPGLLYPRRSAASVEGGLLVPAVYRNGSFVNLLCTGRFPPVLFF